MYNTEIKVILKLNFIKQFHVSPALKLSYVYCVCSTVFYNKLLNRLPASVTLEAQLNVADKGDIEMKK